MLRIRCLIALVIATWALADHGSTSALVAQTAAEVTSASDLSHAADPTEGGQSADAHAADAGHAGGSNPVTLDPDLAIVTAVIFLILLAVLGKFAWQPIVKALDDRERMVNDQLAEAKQNQEEARRLLADHQRQLAGASAEVRQLIDQARKDADLVKQQIVESAQAAATAEKDRALREIHAAKNAALQDLAQKSVDTAVDLAGQIVRRQLSPQDHSQLIGEALDRFSGTN